MSFIPISKSKKWYIVALLVFIINIGFLLGSFKLQGTNPDSNIVPFIFLSLIVTLILVGGGYAGGRVFFVVALPFHGFGLIFMLVSAGSSSDGFVMLAAFIMYMFASLFGFAMGLIAQVIVSYRKKDKK